MKKTYLFCTKLHLFLCEIPPIVLLIISLLNNEASAGLLKLYPLIIFSCAAIIFIFLYFFRFILISYEEVKVVGLFSSKDNALISKDKSIVLTLLPKNKIKVSVRGNAGAPAFSWSKKDEQKAEEIDIFRERAVGNLAAIKRVLTYFDVSKSDIDALLKSDSFEKEYENFILNKRASENQQIITIKFTKTV